MHTTAPSLHNQSPPLISTSMSHSFAMTFPPFLSAKNLSTSRSSYHIKPYLTTFNLILSIYLFNLIPHSSALLAANILPLPRSTSLTYPLNRVPTPSMTTLDRLKYISHWPNVNVGRRSLSMAGITSSCQILSFIL
jgi:hypothetical protein